MMFMVRESITYGTLLLRSVKIVECRMEAAHREGLLLYGATGITLGA